MDPTQAPPKPQPLDPQQQKIMQVLVRQAVKFLTVQATSEALVKRAMAGDPQQAVADALAPLLSGQYAAAASAGVKIDMVTLMAAGLQIVAVMAKMLVAVDVIQEQDVPQFCAAVVKIAVAAHNAKAQQAPQGGGAGAPQQPQPAAPAQGA